MSALPRTNERAVLRLPHVDAGPMPWAAITRRIVLWSLSVIVVMAILAIIAAVVVTVRVTVDADGVVEPRTTWIVRAPDVGTIAAVFVHSGDTVRLGQPLAQLDPLPLSYEIAERERDLETARRELVHTRVVSPLDRIRETEAVRLADAELLRSRATLRDRMADFLLGMNDDSLLASYVPGHHVGLDVAVADVRRAIANRELAVLSARAGAANWDIRQKQTAVAAVEEQIQLLRTKRNGLLIPAPAMGIVLDDDPQAQRGVAMRTGDQLLEIGDIHGWRVVVWASSQDIHEMHLGDSAVVEIHALNHREHSVIRGVLMEIAPAPMHAVSTGNGVGGQTVFRSVVQLLPGTISRNTAELLRTGYAAHVKVTARRVRLATLILEHLGGRLE